MHPSAENESSMQRLLTIATSGYPTSVAPSSATILACGPPGLFFALLAGGVISFLALALGPWPLARWASLLPSRSHASDQAPMNQPNEQKDARSRLSSRAWN